MTVIGHPFRLTEHHYPPLQQGLCIMALFLVGSKTLMDPHETHPRLDGSQLPAVEACNMALILTTFPLDEVLPLLPDPKKEDFFKEERRIAGVLGAWVPTHSKYLDKTSICLCGVFRLGNWLGNIQFRLSERDGIFTQIVSHQMAHALHEFRAIAAATLYTYYKKSCYTYLKVFAYLCRFAVMQVFWCII